MVPGQVISMNFNIWPSHILMISINFSELWNFPIPTISEQESSILLVPITPEEVKTAVFSLPKDSAPGSDGFHAHFFQANWETVQHDIFQMITSSWHSEFILKSFNKTIITLIPKTEKPATLKDLRPISLCNVIYKVLSKIIVNRLRSLMQKYIAPNQGAFLRGRLISDNIVLAGELMHRIHSSRQGGSD